MQFDGGDRFEIKENTAFLNKIHTEADPRSFLTEGRRGWRLSGEGKWSL